MFENGKPTEENIENTMPEDLFEGEAPETSGEPPAEENEGRAETEGPESAAEDNGTDDKAKDGITVKYNGKDVFIPQPDIVKHVQKGLNYDHIYSEHQEYSTVLDGIAKENGMDRKAFLNYLQNQQKQNSIDSAMETLREKYPEMSDNALKEMAELKLQSDTAERQRQAENEAKAREQEQISSWRRLFEIYPDIKAENLPEEVFKKVENNVPPVEAYQEYLIEELNSQLKAEKTNNDNKSRAVGSLASDHKEDDIDPFLQGLFGKR